MTKFIAGLLEGRNFTLQPFVRGLTAGIENIYSTPARLVQIKRIIEEKKKYGEC